MYKIFFFIIVAMLFYISYKNITILWRYRYNKDYIKVYKAVLNNDENALDVVNNYANKCKSLEYKNKGLILKLFAQLEKDVDYKDTLNELDYKQLFYKDGKYQTNGLKLNSDSIVFSMLVMAKAHKKKNNDVIKDIYKKISEIKELDNNVEYLETEAMYYALLKKEDSGVSFFNLMLDGGYASLKYEKNLIGLYKRIASSMLAYNKASMDEYYMNDLHKFAETLVGRNFMKDLGIYNKYKPVKE